MFGRDAAEKSIKGEERMNEREEMGGGERQKIEDWRRTNEGGERGAAAAEDEENARIKISISNRPA